jgi:thymidine kinase
MAKLYFRYGTVGSAKTLNLLAVAHAYEQQDKRVYLIKPRIDTRFGAEVIRSRAGLTRDADLLVDENSQLSLEILRPYHCILVDEAQFLTPHVIEQLRQVTRLLDVPVICYGLRTDFRTQLFPGAQRLMELADALEEIKTTCSFCNRKAVFNLKLLGGRPCLDGPTIELGTEEKYLPTCCDCYFKSVQPVVLGDHEQSHSHC